MNLKQKLARKLKKNGGFTLIEMLIVVAIIAILVAVSIPMVNASLKKAKDATDAANVRAAKAAAIAEYLLNGGTGTVTYCYDASTGKATPVTAPGGTCPPTVTAYGQTATGHVHVPVNADGTAGTPTWVP